MGIFEKCIISGMKPVKRGGLFGKKFDMSLSVYNSTIRGSAFRIYEDNAVFTDYDIQYDMIKKITMGDFEGNRAILVEYSDAACVNLDRSAKIAIYGLDNLQDCFNEMQRIYEERIQKKILARQKRDEEQRLLEANAADFYNRCYAFHVKENTPVYTFSTGKNAIFAMFIGEGKSLNFLKIDGYKQEEIAGIIPYEKIHYFEKAGNVSYTSKINASYSSYGGSMVGGSFSKASAALGGALFGFMGMAAAALMTYTPARQEPTQTSFSIKSDVVKIDDRNVLLNFYSDDKKQYIDIELAQETYNFLQTYLPEKKFSIVEEIEKKKATEQEMKKIEAAEEKKELPKALPEADNTETAEDPMASFKKKIEKLKMLKDAGMITEEEFNNERIKLISTI